LTSCGREACRGKGACRACTYTSVQGCHARLWLCACTCEGTTPRLCEEGAADDHGVLCAVLEDPGGAGHVVIQGHCPALCVCEHAHRRVDRQAARGMHHQHMHGCHKPTHVTWTRTF
jgi:hypothetical protein